MKKPSIYGAAKVTTVFKILIVGLMLTIVVVMPEELYDTLSHLLHLGYEGISFLLEELIQHVFHIDKYVTQSIVFYLWISAAAAGLYFLWRKLPGQYLRIKARLLAAWLRHSTALADHWRELPLVQKIRFIAIYLAGLYLVLSVFS